MVFIFIEDPAVLLFADDGIGTDQDRGMISVNWMLTVVLTGFTTEVRIP